MCRVPSMTSEDLPSFENPWGSNPFEKRGIHEQPLRGWRKGSTSTIMKIWRTWSSPMAASTSLSHIQKKRTTTDDLLTKQKELSFSQQHTRNLKGIDKDFPIPVTVVRGSCFLVTSIKWILKERRYESWSTHPSTPRRWLSTHGYQQTERSRERKERNISPDTTNHLAIASPSFLQLQLTGRPRREINRHLKSDSILDAILQHHPYQDMPHNLKPSDVE